MNSFKRRDLVIGALAVAATLVGPAAMAQTPSGRITFSGGSVAFIGGVSWGSGTLFFRGHQYRLRVRGLQLGSIGGSSFRATGTVYNLRRVTDINGTYGAMGASATAGAGAGVITMSNGNGVQIRAQSSRAGLQLQLAAQGVDIRLR